MARHPIVDQLLSLLHSGKDGLSLSEDAEELLSAELLKHSGSGMRDAVLALAHGAYLLRERFRSPGIADRIIAIAELGIPELTKLGEQVDRRLQDFRKVYAQRTCAEQVEKRAPAIGTKPPAGTLTLAQLNPPRTFGQRPRPTRGSRK